MVTDDTTIFSNNFYIITLLFLYQSEILGLRFDQGLTKSGSTWWEKSRSLILHCIIRLKNDIKLFFETKSTFLGCMVEIFCPVNYIPSDIVILVFLFQIPHMRGQSVRVFMVFVFKIASVGIKPLLKRIAGQPRVCVGSSSLFNTWQLCLAIAFFILGMHLYPSLIQFLLMIFERGCWIKILF